MAVVIEKIIQHDGIYALHEFCARWRRKFLEMKPQFLSKYWTVDHTKHWTLK